jgi:uncharacterized protein (DUF58 family)
MEFDDLRKLEHTSRGQRTALPDDAVVSAIIKVREPSYVPPEVEVRARIDETLFTVSCRADVLKRLEADPKVESIALPKRIDPVRK